MYQRAPAPHAPLKSAVDCFRYGKQRLYNGDCLNVLRAMRPNSISGAVTDPPYGLIEYQREQQSKLRSGQGGVWRTPPSFDGYDRRPLPRFTMHTGTDREAISAFFRVWGAELLRVLKPGAHLFLATNTMMSPLVANAMEGIGFERRGEITRLIRTFRGGDRPKGAEREFADISTMPRSCWEPWGLYRKPISERTVADNLRKWKVGGLRRNSAETPFLDVIASGLVPDDERELAPHPSIKPQHFLRQLVKAVLPLKTGTVIDPFAGSGATLAACEYLRVVGVGIEIDKEYFNMAKSAIEDLSRLKAPALHRVQRFLPGL